MASAVNLKAVGAELWNNGDFDGAIAKFTEAIQICDDNEMRKILYSNRSASFMKKKLYAEAFNDASKCIEIDSNWAKGYSRKGDALFSQGKFADAYDAYNAGLRIDKNDESLKEKLEKASSAISNNTSSNKFNSSSQSNFQGLQSIPVSGILGKVVSYTRFFLLLNAIFYMVPLFGSGFSRGSYNRCVASCVLIQLVVLYSALGIPKFSMSYAQLLLEKPSSMILFLCILLLVSKQYLLALTPVVLFEFARCLEPLFTVS
jgi:tetratricopeptide (TPR) repeat protein